MKKSCITTIIVTIVSFVIAYIFSIAVPYSVYEKIFAFIGIAFLLTGFILLMVIASHKKFLDWIFLILGWIGFILLLLVLGQGGDAPLIAVLPVIIIPFIILLIALVLFIREIRKDHFQIDYIGIVLSIVPFLISAVMILVNI